MSGTLEPGREAFERQDWATAYALLVSAAEHERLDLSDLERTAVAAYLLGRDEESAQAWERAHHECLRAGDPDRAARCAFWVALALLLRGEWAQAGGWLARASRLVEEADIDCLARGYLLVPQALEALQRGDAAAAYDMSARAGGIAERFGDPDLLAFAWLGRAQAVIFLGEVARGMTLCDEVMVAVTTGEVSPVPAGIVYCAVIESCMECFDLRRAAEWTDALSRWCDAQPALVPYRGQCLVHRSQVLQAHGQWAAAISEAERAGQRLSQPPHPALGVALYQQAELHRLRGEFPEAEAAYRRASEHGREPVPGLALLRLAEGRIDAATAASRRIVEESRGPARAPTLAAHVEIMLAAGDVAAAHAAADELSDIAAGIDAPLLHALADHARGSVLLDEGDPRGALVALRRASTCWRELEMPYEAARTRVLVGLACRALGDLDAAELELEGARLAFDRLGARPDVDRVAAPAARAAGATPGALTERECEVLRLVAAGRTNREVAGILTISEHTVARHLQNIFTKLGVSSRAAATGYAYEHGIV